MGNGASTVSVHSVAAEEDLLEIARPDYFIRDAKIVPSEIATAQSQWKLIEENQSQVFFDAQTNNSLGTFSFPIDNCMCWFYGLLLEHLFQHLPTAQETFASTNLNSQGRAFARVIGMAVKSLDDEAAFKHLLEKLAWRHCELGVSSNEFSVMGDGIFCALKKVLGESIYNEESDMLWKKIYSAMLQVIIPIFIRFEQYGESPPQDGPSLPMHSSTAAKEIAKAVGTSAVTSKKKGAAGENHNQTAFTADHINDVYSPGY